MPNTVQAAGEAMPKITRRSALAFLGAIAVPSAAVVASTPSIGEEKPVDLQHWLDTTEPSWVAQYHAARLSEVMNRIDATRAYRSKIDHKHGFVLVVGDPICGKAMPVAKVYIDDGSPLLADDVTGTTACADWERSRS